MNAHTFVWDEDVQEETILTESRIGRVRW